MDHDVKLWRLAMPIDSPSTYTIAWSAMVAGFVRKKYARVTWKREREVMIVFADMIAMVTVPCDALYSSR